MWKLKGAAALCMISLGLAIMTTGCTNTWAKAWGGTVRMNAPPGQRVLGITWKEGASVWVHSRPREPGESVQTHTFNEHSNLGMIQGTVIVQEQ